MTDLENDLFVYMPVSKAELKILISQQTVTDDQEQVFTNLLVKLQSYLDEIEGVINDQSYENRLFLEN